MGEYLCDLFVSAVRRSSDAVSKSQDETDSGHPRRPVATSSAAPIGRARSGPLSLTHSTWGLARGVVGTVGAAMESWSSPMMR